MTSGQTLKAQGIARVMANPTTPPWQSAARAAIMDLALAGQQFTAEDVRSRVGDPPTPNIMGAMLNVAARKGIIRRAGIDAARRSSAHARMVSTWEAGPSAATQTAWAASDSGGLGDSPGPDAPPVVSARRTQWEHRRCGHTTTDEPPESTLDPDIRFGSCAGCMRQGQMFVRVGGRR
jgi:hypothetical protein